jgi:hypothetical protein
MERLEVRVRNGPGSGSRVRNPRMDPRAGSRGQLVYIRFLIGHYTGAKPGVLSGRAFQGYGSHRPWLSQESLVCSDFIPALCWILGIGSTAHGHAAQLRPRRRSFSSTPSQPVGLDCAALKAARKTGGSVWNAASLPLPASPVPMGQCFREELPSRRAAWRAG